MSTESQTKGAGSSSLTTEAAQPRASRSDRGRMVGVDAARALAMIGMLAVHLRPNSDDTAGAILYVLAHGRASILFVLVAGIGIALLSSRPAVHARARQRLLWYAIVLLPLGLALQVLDQPIAVILQHYAAFFLLGICVLGLPKPMLLLLAVAATLVGPSLYLAGQIYLPALFERESVSLADHPLAVLSGLLVSGIYPLITWSAPLLWGIWLGRQDLRSPRNRVMLCLVGLTAAVLAVTISQLAIAAVGAPAADADWRNALSAGPHSQMPLWLVTSIGSAMFALGSALMVADRAPVLTAPFAALGRLALSMYVGHLFVLYWWRDAITGSALVSTAIVAGLLTVAAMILAMVWLAWFRRGPIEMLMHLPWELMDRTLGTAPAGTKAAEPMRPEHSRATAPVADGWRSRE